MRNHYSLWWSKSSVQYGTVHISFNVRELIYFPKSTLQVQTLPIEDSLRFCLRKGLRVLKFNDTGLEIQQ